MRVFSNKINIIFISDIPIKKQDGSDWLAAGETADDGTLLGMKFYVEGITGKVPE